VSIGLIAAAGGGRRTSSIQLLVFETRGEDTHKRRTRLMRSRNAMRGLVWAEARGRVERRSDLRRRLK